MFSIFLQYRCDLITLYLSHADFLTESFLCAWWFCYLSLIVVIPKLKLTTGQKLNNGSFTYQVCMIVKVDIIVII